MNTFEIAKTVLEGYMDTKIGAQRIDFLVAQANEQINEIAQDEKFYDSLISHVGAPQKIDNIILWIVLMSDEDICSDYTSKFKKDFRDVIPVSDLSALVFHVLHLKKVQNIELDGFEYLSEYEEEGIDEVDQFSFTNAFLYVQELKSVQMEF